jgi:hypothetical protein
LYEITFAPGNSITRQGISLYSYAELYRADCTSF